MSDTFREMLTEFYARGFDYLDDSSAGEVRAKRWLNDAMHDIDEAYRWPYLEATATGAAPLTVSDLGHVRSVVTAAGYPLMERSVGEIIDWYGSLTTTGSPQFFYVSAGTVVNVFPVATTDVQVLYWKVQPDMSADSDEPLIPARFRGAIVEYAVAAALRDDQSPDWQMAQQEGDRIVARMRDWAVSVAPQRTVVPALGEDC